MMKGITNVQQMKLIINVSAGYPGVKEWVQCAATPYPDTSPRGGNHRRAGAAGLSVRAATASRTARGHQRRRGIRKARH